MQENLKNSFITMYGDHHHFSLYMVSYIMPSLLMIMYCWFFLLKNKYEVFTTFVHFKSLVENLLSFKIVAIRFDSGGEFLDLNFSNYFKEHGISHQLSCPHTLEHNGYVERKHIHLFEIVIVLLSASKVSHLYWVEAFSTTIYHINRMPTGTKTSPWDFIFLFFFHKSSDYASLKVFCCRCFPWLESYISSKLDPKS